MPASGFSCSMCSTPSRRTSFTHLWESEEDNRAGRTIGKYIPHLHTKDGYGCEQLMDDKYAEPLNCLFINLMPLEEKTYLLFGCDTRYDKKGEYQTKIMQFPTGDVTSDYLLRTIKGILLMCSNWCFSPSLYENSSWKAFFDEYENLKV